jgi:hypothetical protein
MKKLKLFLTTVLALGMLAYLGGNPLPDPTLPTSLTLTWNYSQPDTNTFIKLYRSTDISIPLTNWNMIATVPSTTNQVVIQILPGKAFYYVTATNLWGESDPSNIDLTPAMPVKGDNLKAKR